MTITITIDTDTSHAQDLTFLDVEAVTFNPTGAGTPNPNYAPVAEWERFQEEGRGSEQLVNVSPNHYAMKCVYVVDDRLYVSVVTITEA